MNKETTGLLEILKEIHEWNSPTDAFDPSKFQRALDIVEFVLSGIKAGGGIQQLKAHSMNTPEGYNLSFRGLEDGTITVVVKSNHGL